MSKNNKNLFLNTARRVLPTVNVTGFAIFDGSILCKTTSTPSFTQSVVRDVKENREKKTAARVHAAILFSRGLFTVSLDELSGRGTTRSLIVFLLSMTISLIYSFC